MNLLWLVPLSPFIGALLLAFSCGRMPKKLVAWIGTGSIAISALTVIYIAFQFLGGQNAGMQNQGGQLLHYTDHVYSWINSGHLQLGFNLYLDGLSLSMLFVITGVGFLIHLYSAGYMEEDTDYARFFTYMNLFVSAMIILVLADNLLLLFLGWEGVGLCSYLLIGFWYKNPENGYAARKSFIITRVGDTAFAIGLFLLFKQLGTLNIQDAMSAAQTQWASNPHMATLIALLLLGGAIGKSAQFPLQTWLPDAMAGPTPVSALIHAATMVTAGVYLIARTHDLYLISPFAQHTVALIGVVTLLIAGFSALTQSDIKKVLAYSTISQIGYMFLALGVGAWSFAIFHLMAHAFFKALLFLTAGSIILSVHHKQNIFEMGGLRKALPIPFWSFLIGSLALSAFPPTVAFFSKEPIIDAAWSAPGGHLLWMGATLGAFLTPIYIFRAFFIVFFGEQHTKPHEPVGIRFHLPLIILSVLSLVGGLIHLPVNAVFPVEVEPTNPIWTKIVSLIVPFIGIFIAWQIYYRKVWSIDAIRNSFCGQRIMHFLYSGWGMDTLYDRLFVKPYLWLSHLNRNDLFDLLPKSLASLSRNFNIVLSSTQNGRLRFYIATMATGSIILILMAVTL
jgi:NADH-quinone oxidoreductase subunit L